MNTTQTVDTYDVQPRSPGAKILVPLSDDDDDDDDDFLGSC